ncbi:MAG: hypothetical protein ACFFCY_04600 [Promethearchaeota archaeon]
MGKRKKIDIKKKRKRLLKEKKKEFKKQSIQVEKKPVKSFDLRMERETKLYWIRALTGALSAFVGRLLFGLVGWFMLFWMLLWWFLFPFVVSSNILKYEYDKEEWHWKNIILPGIGIFFFLFMIIGVFLHTLLYFIPGFSSILELFL